MIYIVLILVTAIFLILFEKKENTEFGNSYISKYALGASGIVIIISVFIWCRFDPRLVSPQFVEYKILNYKLPFFLSVDGISLIFILLTTFLFVICILASWGSPIHTKLFLNLLLIIEILLLLTFTVEDVFWFYIFFESILIPIFLIIGIFGSRIRKVRATFFFFIYTLIGSIFILAAIIYIFVNTGSTYYFVLLNYPFTFTEEKWLWLGFFIAFAIKVPIIPFHIWLPEAHVEAPTVGSALLAGILLKLGSFGFIKYSLPLFSNASVYFTPFIYALGTLGVIYASFTAIRQTDLKRIIAYTSIAHINLVVLGIFSNSYLGINGCLIQTLSHGFVSVGLFLLIGILYDRHHTRLIYNYSGLIYTKPFFGITFLILILANIGLPCTSGFVSEILILTAIAGNSFYACLLCATSLIFSSIYSLWLLNRILFGNTKIQYIGFFNDLTLREIFILFVLISLVLLLGLYPDLFIFKAKSALINWISLIRS